MARPLRLEFPGAIYHLTRMRVKSLLLLFVNALSVHGAGVTAVPMLFLVFAFRLLNQRMDCAKVITSLVV